MTMNTPNSNQLMSSMRKDEVVEAAMPNVRGKRETAVWRLARGTDDEAQRPAGQVPRRWLSA